jgi:hypothetical protein
MNFWFVFNLATILIGVLIAIVLLRPTSKNQAKDTHRLTLIDRIGRLVFAAVMVTIGWVGSLVAPSEPTRAAVNPTAAPVVNPTPETSEPQKPITAVASKPPTATQKFVDTVALLIANPYAIQPVNRYTDKDGTLYEYEIPEVNNFIMTRKKNR